MTAFIFFFWKHKFKYHKTNKNEIDSHTLSYGNLLQ